MGVRCTPIVPRGKLTSVSFFTDIIRLALQNSPKGSDSCFLIVHSARWCNIQELEVIVICSLHFLNTGFKPDENQIRDHQAELEGAYNELLQLAAARRARLDESHKLQTFYRDAEEEEMWVSEKAHSLQSTDYGHDLNSAMVLLNKHEVWEWKKPLRLVWKISWIIREFPGCRWVEYAVVDWQGWFAYLLFMCIYLAGTRGWGWLTYFQGQIWLWGLMLAKKSSLGGFFFSLSICYKKWQF